MVSLLCRHNHVYDVKGCVHLALVDITHHVGDKDGDDREHGDEVEIELMSRLEHLAIFLRHRGPNARNYFGDNDLQYHKYHQQGWYYTQVDVDGRLTLVYVDALRLLGQID